MNIIVLNLPRTTNPDELAALFAPYGAIRSHNIVLDTETQMSKGFGFVEMETLAEAEAAIKGLHGSKIGKNTLRVKIAEEKQR